LAKKTLINQQIRFPKVQVIGEDGKSLGQMSSQEAQDKASQDNLDLVLVAEKAQPPVVRIMDHGKYQYQQRKKERKSKKAGESKEIRLSLNIEQHDFDFKHRQAEKFLKKGHPLKVSMMLHGRQRAFGSRAEEQVNQFVFLANFLSG